LPTREKTTGEARKPTTSSLLLPDGREGHEDEAVVETRRGSTTMHCSVAREYRKWTRKGGGKEEKGREVEENEEGREGEWTSGPRGGAIPVRRDDK
jgi:hypothetical protein